MSEPFGTGLRLDSETWLAIGRMVFGRQVRVARTGRWQDDFVYEIDPHESFRYYCHNCKKIFESLTTPTRCPNCEFRPQYPASGVEVTHHGSAGGVYTGVTFPFGI